MVRYSFHLFFFFTTVVVRSARSFVRSLHVVEVFCMFWAPSLTLYYYYHCCVWLSFVTRGGWSVTCFGPPFSHFFGNYHEPASLEKTHNFFCRLFPCVRVVCVRVRVFVHFFVSLCVCMWSSMLVTATLLLCAHARDCCCYSAQTGSGGEPRDQAGGTA